MRVMVIEDEASCADQVITVVEKLGGDCAWMTDLDDAVADILEAQPPYQALVLDRMLNGEKRDPLDIIAQLRRQGCMLPVIVASALGGIDHELEGKGAGAVDYISKPYKSRELEVKLRLHTNRERFTCHSLEIDVRLRAVYVADEWVPMAPKCFDILCLLAQNVGETVSRNALHRAAWPHQTTICRSRVDTAMRRLRQEIGRVVSSDAIELVSGVGYRLNPDFL